MTLTVVRVEGNPRDRGRAVGRALAEPTGRSLAFCRRFLERRGLPPNGLPRALAPYRAAAEAALPELLAEIDGMADGSDASWWELFAANSFEELEASLSAPVPAAERCTGFAVAGPGGTLLGHNEQWYAGEAGNVAVVVARPEREPAFASPTIGAYLPAVGMNATGTAQSIMSLSAEDDGVGVPRVLVSRHSLEAAGLRDGARRAAVAGRAGGYAHIFAEKGGSVATVETSSTRHVVLDGTTGHTNHYLDPRLAAGAPRASGGSVARLDRLQRLLDERRPVTPEEAMDVLRDHGSEPEAICMHADPAEGEEATAVLFSMVCHLEERRMWVAAGNPCEHHYEEIDLPEVA